MGGWSFQNWLEDGGLRDPVTESQIADYREKVERFGAENVEVRVEAGSLRPVEKPDES